MSIIFATQNPKTHFFMFNREGAQALLEKMQDISYTQLPTGGYRVTVNGTKEETKMIQSRLENSEVVVQQVEEAPVPTPVTPSSLNAVIQEMKNIRDHFSEHRHDFLKNGNASTQYYEGWRDCLIAMIEIAEKQKEKENVAAES